MQILSEGQFNMKDQASVFCSGIFCWQPYRDNWRENTLVEKGINEWAAKLSKKVEKTIGAQDIYGASDGKFYINLSDQDENYTVYYPILSEEEIPVYTKKGPPTHTVVQHIPVKNKAYFVSELWGIEDKAVANPSYKMSFRFSNFIHATLAHHIIKNCLAKNNEIEYKKKKIQFPITCTLTEDYQLWLHGYDDSNRYIVDVYIQLKEFKSALVDNVQIIPMEEEKKQRAEPGNIQLPMEENGEKSESEGPRAIQMQRDEKSETSSGEDFPHQDGSSSEEELEDPRNRNEPSAYQQSW